MEKVSVPIPDMVYQNELSECGLACICMATQHLDNAPSLYQLREEFPVSLYGASMSDLIDILTLHNVEATPVQFDISQLGMLPTPAILHYGGNHFIYLAYSKGNYAYVMDPAIGPRLLKVSALSPYLSGYAILCRSAVDANVKKPLPGPLKWLSAIWQNVKQSDKKLLNLSLLAASGAFFIPLFISIALDKLLPGNQESSVLTLACIFLLAIFTTSMLEYSAKKMLIQRSVAQSMHQLSSTFFKLLRNQLSFFERRETGDIAARYNAYERAQLRNISINNERLVTSVILVAAISAMLYINPLLTMLSLFTILIYGCTSIYYQGQRVILTQELEKSASAKSELLYESISGIVTLKTASILPKRSMVFSGRLERMLVAWQQNALNETQQRIIYSIIASVELIFMISLALPLLHSGKLTFGGFYAFTFCRQIALSSATGFFLAQLQRKECDVAVMRADDMISSAKDHQLQSRHDFDVVAKIDTLNYRYDKYPILQDVNLTLTPGKKIAILGVSGSGKTTLLKIIAGLMPVNSGSLIIEQEAQQDAIQDWSWLAERSFIVTQDDILLHTTVKNNIALFDSTITNIRCLELLEQLGLSKLIAQYPNGLDTVISENNSPLSVGQKQRLMVARALAQAKPILLLDEPTANLDSMSAHLAMDAIFNSEKTIIVVTHENQHLDNFDEVYCMDEGRLSRQPLKQVA